MRYRTGLAIAAFATASFLTASPASAQDLIIDTGPGNPTTTGALIMFNDSGGFFQFVGMKITLDEPTDIGRIDAWMRGSGDINVKLRLDDGNQPGAELEFEEFNVLFNNDPAWVSFSGFEWSVDAGDYWVTFEPIVDAGSGSFPPNVPSPLEAYSFLADGNPGWVDAGTSFKLGLRVYTVAGPEPILVPGEFPTIQDAIDFAANGQVIEVAPGTYNEAISFNGRTITVRSAGGPGVTTIDATGLNQPVVRVSNGSGAATRLEGFTITGGVHTTSLAQGGGISVEAFGGSTFITVADCIITGNIAESGGGAAVVFNGEAAFENCTFHDNSTEEIFGSGGGLYVNTGTATVDGCTFSENYASSGGGAINVNVEGTVVANDCTFVNNTSDNAGGAVVVISSTSDADFTDCTFEGNEAAQAGAVMVNGTSADFAGCNFINNTATFAGSTAGGGIQAQGAATVTITGCEFEDNNAHLGGGVQYISMTGSSSITGSSFRNNTATLNGGGVQVLGGNAPSIGTTDFCGNSPNDISGSFSDGGGNTFASTCTPENNDPDDPELILEPASHQGTFEGATNSGTSSCEPDGVDVFYAFTITNGPIDILIDTCGSNADTALAVFDSNDVEIGCATSCDGFPCSSNTACLPLPDLANGTYLIRVSLESGAVAGSSLSFVLTFSETELLIPGDFNGDQVVDEDDRALLCAAMGTSTGHPNFIEAADFDENGTIDQLDQIAFNNLLPPCNGDIVSSATFQPPADGVVDAADLAYLLGAWGAQPSCADTVTSRTFAPPPDGKVDGADLAYLLGAWGSCR